MNSLSCHCHTADAKFDGNCHYSPANNNCEHCFDRNHSNIINKNGKKYIRQAKLPRGAYPQKPLPEVLEPYMKGRLNWQNLKDNKCPKCYKDFMLDLMTVPSGDQMVGQLFIHGCGFRIRERRYSQIVNSQITAHLEEQLQREQEELL